MRNGFLTIVETGHLLPDLLYHPRADGSGMRAGQAAVREVREFVRTRVDPAEVDRTRRLPADLLADMREQGLFRLRLDADLGGRELSDHAAFRVVEAAAEWSVTAGQVLAIQNGVGAAALLSALPSGPLRDHVRQRVAQGVLSGFAATEPTGQNNTWPGLTATPTDDGSAYLLHGEKLYTGNGTVADLLAVSATVRDSGPRRVAVCFVDTADPGFIVRSDLDFMGSAGLPNGALGFDGVRVPAAHLLAGEPEDPRLPPLIGSVALVGALYFTAAPASAVARQCARWSREFVARRSIDGRGLGEYDQIQRIVATTLSEVYAIDSVIRWCLLGAGLTDYPFERLMAKNICTTTAWRIADRTLSLLGGEGLETEHSKRRRGAEPLPMERFFRDARGLRVAGNIDFRLDFLAGRQLLARTFQVAAGHGTDATADADLSAANRAHLRSLDGELGRFAKTCQRLAARPEPAAARPDEHAVTLVGRLAAELFTMCAVLSRTHQLATSDDGAGQELADGYCVDAWHRLADLWRRLDAGAGPDYAEISRRWLTDARPDHLIDLEGER
jgi:alkylation response protein AidB-like acyl-CoA dehydrogenase